MKWQPVYHMMTESSSKLRLEQKYNPQGKLHYGFNVFPPEITKVFQGLLCLSLKIYNIYVTKGTCVVYILLLHRDIS